MNKIIIIIIIEVILFCIHLLNSSKNIYFIVKTILEQMINIVVKEVKQQNLNS